jgi:hypothetical protein
VYPGDVLQNLPLFRLISWLPFLLSQLQLHYDNLVKLGPRERSMLVVEAAELAVCDVEQ